MDVYGLIVVLEVKLVELNIRDYGVVSIYMTPTGAYAYGFTLLKNPDEERPHIYIHAGLQNETFDGGYLYTDFFKARIAVLMKLNETVATYTTGSDVKKFSLKTPVLFEKISRVVVASINVTGREADYPSLKIEYVKVTAIDTHSEEVLDMLINIDKEINGSTQILVENENIGYPLKRAGVKPMVYIYVAMVLAILVASTIVLIKLIWRRKAMNRGGRRR